MTTVTRTFVSYALHVGFFHEYDVREVSSREIGQAKSNMPERAFSFHFFDQTTTVIDGEELEGKAKSHSGTYYPNGKIWTTQELKDAGKSETLIQNSENFGGRLVECCLGNWQPFDKNDQLIGTILTR